MATSFLSPAVAADAPRFSHEDWATVLERFVDAYNIARTLLFQHSGAVSLTATDIKYFLAGADFRCKLTEQFNVAGFVIEFVEKLPGIGFSSSVIRGSNV